MLAAQNTEDIEHFVDMNADWLSGLCYSVSSVRFANCRQIATDVTASEIYHK